MARMWRPTPNCPFPDTMAVLTRSSVPLAVLKDHRGQAAAAEDNTCGRRTSCCRLLDAFTATLQAGNGAGDCRTGHLRSPYPPYNGMLKKVNEPRRKQNSTQVLSRGRPASAWNPAWRHRHDAAYRQPVRRCDCVGPETGRPGFGSLRPKSSPRPSPINRVIGSPCNTDFPPWQLLQRASARTQSVGSVEE